MASRVFKSPEARARLAAWDDRFLAKVTAPVERREVPTAGGPVRVLAVGAAGRPPLVCLHGTLTGAAHAAAELGPLADRFRVLLPDIPGHSVRGAEYRLPLTDPALAGWLGQVLDGLGLDRADLYGISWGGFLALRAAVAAPARVRRVALLVPAGVVGGPVWKGITRLMFPLMWYRLFPSERRLRRFLGGLLTTWDDDWANYLGDAFRDFVLDLRVPPLATDAELRGLSAPVLAVGAAEDLSFPGGKLVARVKALVPGAETELVAGSKHMPPTTPEFRRWLADRVTAFLG
jgi:pimeloyl-ACP methyl ester carboxylesterase